MIDDCLLARFKASLNNHHIIPDLRFELTSYGVSKRQHEDFDINQTNKIPAMIQEKMLQLKGSTCFRILRNE